jgi:hypothetical protein
LPGKHATSPIGEAQRNTGRRCLYYTIGSDAWPHLRNWPTWQRLDWRELGYFDTVPNSNSIGHTGALALFVWPDGVVTISDTESGLFVLQPALNWQYLPLSIRQ